jgi:hypothetical protein
LKFINIKDGRTLKLDTASTNIPWWNRIDALSTSILVNIDKGTRGCNRLFIGQKRLTWFGKEIDCWGKWRSRKAAEGQRRG